MSERKGTFFWRRPHLGRRMFFRSAAAAMGGYILMPTRPMETIAQAGVTPMGTADKVIFILLAGAPSHIDTFDLKEGAWTPAAFAPTSYGGTRFPQGLMPNLARNLDSIALVRSSRSWAAVHQLSQTWWQIGRNPVTGLAKIAPHIGSVVSIERRAKDSDTTLPAFLSLNASGTVAGNGYLPPDNAPFLVSPSGAGLPNTTNAAGVDRFNSRYQLLVNVDESMRDPSPLGASPDEAAAFRDAARQMMYNSSINNLFISTAAERTLYGNTAFGNACLAARNVVRANKGGHFVQITLGGWDNHSNIYQPNANLSAMSKQLDIGLGSLIDELKADGTLNRTLIVAMGEFGRTVGPLNTAGGRDHHLQQSVLFAGAGIRGGRTIGATNALGDDVADFGWSRKRYVRPEDVEATIYSSLGIDWTTVRHDDPLGRGFEYVPFAASQDLYGPINELWG